MTVHKLFLPNPSEAPTKKLRGGRGYFRSLRRGLAFPHLDFSDGTWFDDWHDHIDWEGYGNLSWRMRRQHLELSAMAFESLDQRLATIDMPYQLWLMLAAADSSEDAVFVHTPNPNAENFPKVFGEAEWGLPALSDLFDELLPGYGFRAGGSVWEGTQYYFVYSPQHGVPIEPGAGI